MEGPFHMIRKEALAIALLALAGLAAAPCAAQTVRLTSNNWSGYLFQSTPVGQLPPQTTFTFVRARWQQPTVSCTVPNARTAIWVGLDGWGEPHSTGTVEQLGTMAICGPTAGAAPLSYKAWWEMKAESPNNEYSADEYMFDVSPGDYIEALVTYTEAGTFVLHLRDLTTHQEFSTTKTCNPNRTCYRNSAEFIVERPGDPTTLPLGDYGTVVFTEMDVRASSNENIQRADVTMRQPNTTTILSSCGGGPPEPQWRSDPLEMPREVGCKWYAATP
jgi:Peptidase A4 family